MHNHPATDTGAEETRNATFVAGTIFFGALVFYLCTLQSELYGDGIFYLTVIRDALAGNGHAVGHHPLYPPLLLIFVAGGNAVGLSMGESGAIFSALTGAAGVALAYLLFREWTGGRRGVALFATILLALTPNTWFFATTTENHSLHFFWVTLMLLALTRVARHQSLWWVLLPGFLYIPAYLSHTTALMMAPFLVLSFLVFRTEAGIPMPWKSVNLAGFGNLLVIFAALLGPVAITRLCLTWIFIFLNGGTDPFFGQDPASATIMSIMAKAGVESGMTAWLWHNPICLAAYTWENLGKMLLYIRDDWFFHTAMAGVLIILGTLPLLRAFLRRGGPWFLMIIVLFGPYAWLFAFWGFYPVEKGAYYLPILPAMLGIGMVGILNFHLLLDRLGKILPILALGLILVQGWFGFSTLSNHGKNEISRKWADDAAAIVAVESPKKGIVLTGNGHWQYFLKFFHQEQIIPILYEELLGETKDGPAAKRVGIHITEQIRLYLEMGYKVFADQEFWEKAKAHGDCNTELEKLPWSPIKQGYAQGRLLVPGS